MISVELHSAFQWDCDDCGRENFCRGIKKELSPEEETELREEFDIPESMLGSLTLVPTKVKCLFCKSEFDVTFPEQNQM